MPGVSYSYGFQANGPSDLDERIGDCVASVPVGPGHDEAEDHQPVVRDVVTRLAEVLDAERYTVNVSGHGSDGYTSISLSVSRTEVDDSAAGAQVPPT